MDSATTTKTHSHDSLSISRPIHSFYSTIYNGRFQEQQPHFLDSCFLCKKALSFNKDIFMYRGDTPFCSEDCREEQIQIDEAKEKKRKLFASIKALKKKEKREKSSTSSPNYPFYSGAVAAA